MSLTTGKQLLLSSAAGAAAGYQISRSLRFNSSDSAYLSRTPASAGNRRKWTWAGWVKLSSLSSGQNVIFSATDGSTPFAISFQSDGAILFGSMTFAWKETTARFRDFSAWYHFCVAVDTDQTSNANRLKFYVNGVQQTQFSTDRDLYLNTDLAINGQFAHDIGRYSAGSNYYFNGYLAEAIFVDGQQLTPSSFTETDANGVLQPKAYTGSYGTNGFKLDFSDNSAATATTLGKDSSGNSNNFTPNNLSVTAGAGNDSLVDSPTNYGATDTGVGGEIRGNYCTWNPLCRSSAYATISNGNLDLAVTTNDYGYSGTMFVPNSGKWYFEITLSATTGNGPAFGIVSAKAEASDMYDSSYASGLEYGGPVYAYNPGQGTKMSQSSSASYVTASSPSTNDVFMVAVDFDNGAIYFGKNGTWLNSGVPTSGASKTGAAFTSIEAESYAPVIHAWGTGITGVLNAGARPFAYTAPSGFKALCTQNLPAPVIAQPSTAMDVKLYTGNGSTQTISGLGFSPDLVWIKRRDSAGNHALFDVIRGTGKFLESSTTGSESTSVNSLTAFNADGFSLGTETQTNTNSATYCSWNWDAGSSTVTNTQGSITSSVRANASAGFSVVTFTSNASGNATVGHGLGVAPSLVILKNRTGGAGNWLVFHKAVCTKDNFLYLNSTNALGTYTDVQGAAIPSSTVFGINAGIGIAGSVDCVAYCFAPVAGYSSFGSYTGNGSSDGPFVYTGFRSRWILIKQSSAAGENWAIFDTARDAYNVASTNLFPNLSSAEASASFRNIDILSNGFKIKNTDGTFNTNAATYLWAAFAESPFAYARAR